uniref:ORF3 n=2 Tax=Torque teno sus virus k2a TaxID=1968861 RepID=A0A1V0D9K0_9VIRU|nr:ORF3 [Torque teno sus virus k2a]
MHRRMAEFMPQVVEESGAEPAKALTAWAGAGAPESGVKGPIGRAVTCGTGPPSMEERWLTVAYAAHGLFCNCNKPKDHLEQCLTTAVGDAEDRQGGGAGGSGDVTFDIGIDALIAAADIRMYLLSSGEAMEPKDSKQTSGTPVTYPAPINPGTQLLQGFKTPPRYTPPSLTPGNMTVTGLLEQILSKSCSNSPQRARRRRRHTHSLGRKPRESPTQKKTKRALSLLRAAVPATKKRKKRDPESSSPASEDSSSTSSEW